MPFLSEAASAIKTRFGFHNHPSEQLSLTQNTPDLFKSAVKDNLIQNSVVRNITDWDDESVAGQSSAAVSRIQSFELCEDPSFWKDHNVQVIIRMRPLSNNEISVQGNNKCVRQESCQTISWTGPPEARFTFDLVADENVSQENLFKVAGVPMVDNCMGGYNSCMFAYGQTGSGKTHTMLGDIEGGTRRHSVNCGMTPRIFEHLFSRIQKEKEVRRDEKLKFTCKCSFLEIYNEQILDLLDPSSSNLQIREDSKKGVYVENLKEMEVTNARDVIQLLVQGAANRKVAATNMNRASSRSHSVFTCIIESQWDSQGVTHFRFARLNLVDLAGSERQKSSGAEGERLKEATNINKSLSTLGLVIMNLVGISNGKSHHVPYRDSKLTFLLQDSLGGNSKTIIIANISPSICCSLETLSTLKFAQRAKFIRNNAIVNEDASGDVIAMRLQIQQLKKEVSRLRSLGGGGEIQDKDTSVMGFPGSPVSSFKWGNAQGSFSPLTSAKRVSQNKDYEIALVGAFRREKDKEIALQALREENEAAKKLVKQREDEIQCLKMRLKFREAERRRLEAVASGKISAETHLLLEKEEHLKEIEVLQAKVDRSQDVTRFALENLQLTEEIKRLKTFYEEGEREIMNGQIMVLQNKLLEALDWKLMHEPDMKTNADSMMEDLNRDCDLISKQESSPKSRWQSSLREENEFLRIQAIQNHAEMDTILKKLEVCLGEKEKLERQVDDLKAKFEQEKSHLSETTTEGRDQIDLPSININGQMELKTMVDAIAAASHREAEAHETAIILSRENEDLRVKLRAMLEDNSKLIELYEQAAAENNRNITKGENSQEIVSKVTNDYLLEKREEEAALKRVIEDLQHQLTEINEEKREVEAALKRAIEDNSKLIELYEQAAAENNRNITQGENSQEIVSKVGNDYLLEKREEEAALKRVIEDLQHQLMEISEEKREDEAALKRVIEDLQHQLTEINEENEKLLSLYERAMQEKDDLKRTLSCSGHERVETKGEELDCVEKLVEVDEGERDSIVGTASEEVHDRGDGRYDDNPATSGSDICLESDGHEEEKLLKEENEVDILVNTEKVAEVSNFNEAKLSMELNYAKEKLERVDEQILDAVRTLGYAEKEIVQVDELSKEIQVIEHDIQVKRQQFKSSNLELHEAHNRRALTDKKLSALKYSLSNFIKHGSFSYFEQRVAKARATLNDLASHLDRKKGELVALQASKQLLESDIKKNQESEAELTKNIACIKSKLEEENRMREDGKVLFAIDNTHNIDSSVKSWQFSGKAFDLLKLEEEKTKLQAEMKLSQEKIGVIRKELGNLNRKVAKVESQIQAVGLEVQQGLRTTEEKERSLQRATNEKEMFFEFRDNGMLEMEHLIIDLHQYVFEYDLKEAETKILGEELQMNFLRAEELQTDMIIAANSNFLSSKSCVGTFEKVEEQMKNLRTSIQETKLLLEGISRAT
ncbi:kinesin-like protein KIN-12E [Vicia villosa]|uniref:kinesin-like protein KIN-12E n=1 Tax=Vicia villosa TaxID=3911 RepID=UPI00273B19C6|nr:kinesin-like protein KIN-12E [Vicia villosa]